MNQTKTWEGRSSIQKTQSIAVLFMEFMVIKFFLNCKPMLSIKVNNEKSWVKVKTVNQNAKYFKKFFANPSMVKNKIKK